MFCCNLLLMFRILFLGSIVLCHLGIFHLAKAERKLINSNCQPFPCGKLGTIKFPFSPQMSFPDCGLLAVDGCLEDTQKIQLEEGGEWSILENISQANSVFIHEEAFSTHLNSRSCETFNNLTSHSSPFLSIQITSNLTMMKCDPGVYSPPNPNFTYTGCSDFTIFYNPELKHSAEYHPRCKLLQLPVPANRDPPRPNEDIFSLLTASFEVDVIVSRECKECHLKGGQCSIGEKGEFQCSRKERKKLSWLLGLGLRFGVPFIMILVVFVLFRRHKKRYSLTNFRPLPSTASAVAAMGVALITLWYIRRKVSSTNSYVDCWNKKTQVDRSIDAFLRDHVRLMQKRYSYSEIKKMTESFGVKLGQGGYGSVFKGKFPDGRLVAVKVLKESKTSSEEFINEVATISRTSHVNIVALLGYCVEGSKRALIYEFMSKGSLEKYIHQDLSQVNHLFGYEVLHQIALGIARGLEYLHRGCNTRILHFDIKPHNILLDENFSPKISDFGLAKICLQRENIISMSGARGTAGYIAPEVFCRYFGGVSHKSDVYSYGMMVLEMIGGRNNVPVEVDNTSETYFPDWIYKRLEHGAELGLYAMRSEDENRLARRMIIVSLWCIQTKPSDRPPMSRVIEMLQGSFEPLDIPPRPYLFSASRSPQRSEAISSATLLCESKEELIGSLPA